MATFHNSYAQADLWVTTELVNTSSKQVTVAVKLSVSLDDADEFCIVDHVHTSQDIVIEGNSTMPYSLPPVIFFNRMVVSSILEVYFLLFPLIW